MRTLLLIALLPLLAACSEQRAMSAARHTIASAATVTDIVDRVNAGAIHRVCQDAADPMACVSEHRFNDVMLAVHASDAQLRTAQALLDRLEGEDNARDRIPAILACVADSVRTLVALGIQLGFELPRELYVSLGHVSRLLGTCEGGAR